MKFIADAMLGRLAKWLRILGFDVLYSPDFEDRQVIKIGQEQERTILTRDTRLFESRAVRNAFFIRSDRITEQLLEMRGILDFHDPARGERCTICNERLQVVADRNEVRDLVPEYVYSTLDRFTYCKGCGKAYWEGSHYKDIRKRIREIVSESHEG